jgi:hypothetical protein
MKRQPKTTSVIPPELQDVATTGDVNALEARMEKCFSSEKYEEFQTAVQKITLETIDSGAGRTKIKAHGREATKEYLDENSWKKLLFWVPTVISVVSVAVAVWAVYHGGAHS